MVDYFSVVQNVEQFMKDAQAVVQHLDSEEVRIQKTYEYGGDPQASPIEALRRHRHFQDSIMTGPTNVIRQGMYGGVDLPDQF